MSTQVQQQARIAKVLATLGGGLGIGFVLAAIPEIPLFGVIMGSLVGLAGGALVSKDLVRTAGHHALACAPDAECNSDGAHKNRNL